MGHPISESESLALYAVVDSNRDGRVSLDDFLEFLVSQSSMAARALTNGNSDVIVDMRVSSTREEDGELLKQGYTPVQQHNATTRHDTAAEIPAEDCIRFERPQTLSSNSLSRHQS